MPITSPVSNPVSAAPETTWELDLAEDTALGLGSASVEKPAVKDVETRSDQELLTQFLSDADESAFAGLVKRHGTLVMGVALRTVREAHAAEDVFQATFLVLAQKARSIRKQKSLASWLHGTAYRIGMRLLAKRQRRSEEALSGEPIVDCGPWEAVGSAWEQQVLDEELQQLPEHYREPLVLHELEGKSCRELADAMGLSVAAVEGRLKRGRKELKFRLMRRGVGLSGALLAVQALQSTAQAAPTASLIADTVTSSLTSSSLTDISLPETELTQAGSLAEQEILAMTTAKTTTLMTVAGTVLLAGGILGSGMFAQSGDPAGPGVTNLGTALAFADDQGLESDPFSDGGGRLEESFGDSDGESIQETEEELLATGIPGLGSRNSTNGRGAEALNEPTNFRFEDVPLADVVHKLSELHHVPIVLDSLGMRRASVDPYKKTLSAELNGVRLRNALEVMLKDLGLTARASGEVILITDRSPERGAESMMSAMMGGGASSFSRRQAETEAARWDVHDYRTEDVQSQKIGTALKTPVDIEFIDTELSEAMLFIAERYQIPMIPDESAMADLGIGLDTPINLVVSAVELKSALDLMLEPQELDYYIEDQVLKVTTKEAADQKMETRVYELRRLPKDFTPEHVARVIYRTIRPDSWGPNPWVYIEQVTPPGDGMGEGDYDDDESFGGGDGFGLSPGAGSPFGGQGATRTKPVKEEKKYAAIEPLPGCLVITQSQRAHREITALLEQLERFAARENPLNRRTDETSMFEEMESRDDPFGAGDEYDMEDDLDLPNAEDGEASRQSTLDEVRWRQAVAEYQAALDLSEAEKQHQRHQLNNATKAHQLLAEQLEERRAVAADYRSEMKVRDQLYSQRMAEIQARNEQLESQIEALKAQLKAAAESAGDKEKKATDASPF